MLGNFKIKVNNELESKEAQELFFELGYCWNTGLGVKNLDAKFLYAKRNTITMGYCSDNFSDSGSEQLTLSKLRDLVVSYRNDMNDWNCIDPEFKEQKLYLCSDKDLYVFDDVRNYWKVSSKNGVDLVLNRLIMKGDESFNSLIGGISEGLISGADALRAIADGKEVEYFSNTDYTWKSIFKYHQSLETIANNEIDINHKFRLKPRTIKFEVEIPKPFQPKVGEFAFYLDGSCKDGFDFYQYDGIDLGNPLWRSSEEIKQVVEALRNSIKGVDNV